MFLFFNALVFSSESVKAISVVNRGSLLAAQVSYKSVDQYDALETLGLQGKSHKLLLGKLWDSEKLAIVDATRGILYIMYVSMFNQPYNKIN